MTDITLEHYSAYESLKLRRHPNGVLELIMGSKDGKPGKLSTADDRMHRELADIWRDIDTDPDTRVVVIRGEGKGFSGGGDLDLVQQMAEDFDVRTRVRREARDLVYNIINCSKPIVSAMHGAAVGAGLVAGLLADISIAARAARIIDGHTRLGVTAGDHGAIRPEGVFARFRQWSIDRQFHKHFDEEICRRVHQRGPQHPADQIVATGDHLAGNRRVAADAPQARLVVATCGWVGVRSMRMHQGLEGRQGHVRPRRKRIAEVVVTV